jgi:hypothetical protein
MSLVAEMIESDQEQTDRARREYIELLKKNQPTPQAKARLRELMDILGRTRADLAADLQTIETACRLRGMVEQIERIEKEATEQDRALAESRIRTESAVRKAQQAHAELVSKRTLLGIELRNANDARQELKRLAAERPELVDPE